MNLTIDLLDSRYQINLFSAWSIAVPLDFSGEQPNHFGAEPAIAEPLSAGGFVGDVEQGGSCNVAKISFIPH